ncbi:MAG: hypothetical protein AAF573_17835 [Bacteroidota bacterium]
MKNQILDDIFNDDFRNMVAPDEKIIWEGQPRLSQTYRFMMIASWLALLVVFAYMIIKGLDWFGLIYSVVFLTAQAIRIIQNKKVRYLITDRRILFQLWEKRKKVFRSIPFSEIRGISLRKDGYHKSTGAILIKTKGKVVPFKTKDLKGGQERTFPSLELLENVDEVAQYIETGIQQNQLPEG